MTNKPDRRGEREISRKTIARGMPGETGVTVVTMLVCLFYFAREAAGALGTRHSLCPQFFLGPKDTRTARVPRAARSRTLIPNPSSLRNGFAVIAGGASVASLEG